MKSKRKLLRRSFLAAAGSGMAALGAAPAAVASPGAPDKIVLAVIGCGDRGTYHVQDLTRRSRSRQGGIELAAVCDVYEPRLRRAEKISGAKGYDDYRAVLAREDIDCVVIATPDHWHARMCLDAFGAGKDVYCEKPWTRTAGEAKQCYHAVRKTKRICQIGTQHTADGKYWTAREAIAGGKIGKVVWSQTSYSRNSRAGEWNYPVDREASPENLDWSAFLGSAPERAFDRERFFRFRKYWDYSGGIATDLHYHKLAPLLVAIGPEFPRRVTSAGGIWVHKDEGQASPREVPDTFMTLIDFPGEHSVVIASSMASAHGLPDVIRGHEARVEFRGDHIEIIPELVYRGEFKARNNGQEVVKMPARRREAHMDNFISCVRSRREEDLNCGPDLGYRTMVCIALSVDAYRRDRVLFWDPEKEETVERDPRQRSA
jgi:predicted dehydrogenase